MPRTRRRSSTTVSDNGIVLLKRKRGNETKTQRSRTGWSFTWEDLDDLVAFPDASWLLETVSRELLKHHVEALRKGVDPATGAPLPKLDPRGQSASDVRDGKRPDIRGIARTDGRDLASLLTRSKITGRSNVKIGKGRLGGSATCKIGGGTGGHGKYLTMAANDHRVDHLAVEGDAERVIDQAVELWLAAMLQGEPGEMPNFGRVQGRDL